MSQPLKRDPQRNAVIACGGLIGTALVLAALGRHAPETPSIGPDTASRSERLFFGDLADGGVAVTEAGTGREVGRIVPGEGGFVRVTMRSLAGDRKRKGLTAEEPFTLARMRNGELLLQDPLTGRTMLLDAFGPSNAGVFAEILDHGRTVR